MMKFKILTVGYTLLFSLVLKANDSNFLNLKANQIAPGSTMTILNDLHFPPSSSEPREPHKSLTFFQIENGNDPLVFPERITKFCALNLRELYENETFIPKNDIYTVHSVETKITTFDPAGQYWEDRYLLHLDTINGISAFYGYGYKETKIYFNNSNLYIYCKVQSDSTNENDYHITEHIRNEITIQEMLNYIGPNIVKIKETKGIKIH